MLKPYYYLLLNILLSYVLLQHLFKLKMAARERGIVLQFLTQNFSRNSCNSTRYNYRTNIINWRVEWIFPNVDEKPLKFVDEKCPENKKLCSLLDKYLNPDAMLFEGSKALGFYKAAGFRGVKILMKGTYTYNILFYSLCWLLTIIDFYIG